MFGDFEKFRDDVNRHHAKLDKELAKLTAEPCMTPFEVGDRVIVAIGLIGYGHTWIRKECKVLEKAATSTKISFQNIVDKEQIEWVNNILITDVLEIKNITE